MQNRVNTITSEAESISGERLNRMPKAGGELPTFTEPFGFAQSIFDKHFDNAHKESWYVHQDQTQALSPPSPVPAQSLDHKTQLPCHIPDK